MTLEQSGRCPGGAMRVGLRTVTKYSPSGSFNGPPLQTVVCCKGGRSEAGCRPALRGMGRATRPEFGEKLRRLWSSPCPACWFLSVGAGDGTAFQYPISAKLLHDVAQAARLIEAGFGGDAIQG